MAHQVATLMEQSRGSYDSVGIANSYFADRIYESLWSETEISYN